MSRNRKSNKNNVRKKKDDELKNYNYFGNDVESFIISFDSCHLLSVLLLPISVTQCHTAR